MRGRNPFDDFFNVVEQKPMSTSEYLNQKLNNHIDQATIIMELKELLKDTNVRRYIELVTKMEA